MIRVFTISFDPAEARFDDSELRSFLSEVRVNSVDHHLFEVSQQFYLTFVVNFYECKKGVKKKQKDDNWKVLLNEDNKFVFEQLRIWRKTSSDTLGIPPYVIMTNRTLIEIANKMPRTKADLSRIHGLGEKTLEKYGEEILSLLQSSGGGLGER